MRPVKADIKSKDLRNCFDRDHPASFTLELEQIVASVSSVSLELIVSQTGVNITADHKHSLVKLSVSTDQANSQRSSSGCSSLSQSPHLTSSHQLRLSPAVRLYLCSALDPGDWIRLAAGLRLNHLIIDWLKVWPHI